MVNTPHRGITWGRILSKELVLKALHEEFREEVGPFLRPYRSAGLSFVGLSPSVACHRKILPAGPGRAQSLSILARLQKVSILL